MTKQSGELVAAEEKEAMKKTRRIQYYEQAAPARKSDHPSSSERFDTALKSGPVKTWANMTPEEREDVRKHAERSRK